MKRTDFRIVLALLTCLALADRGAAAPTDAQMCSARKIKAAAKHARSVLRCYQMAMLMGTNPDPNCISDANDKFSRAFSAADGEGCFVTGDETAVRDTVATCTSEIICGLKAGCCEPAQLVLTGLGGGSLQLGGLPESTFPLGAVAVVDAAPAPDTNCRHDLVTRPGVRGDSARGARSPDGASNHAGDRAPPIDSAGRRRHRRALRRADRRIRYPRRTGDAAVALSDAV